MSQGLRLLPFVWAHRSEQPDFVRCRDCMQLTDEATRRAFHCGWLPESSWLRPGTVPIPMLYRDHEEIDCFPGYTTSLPGVWETSDWYHWYEKGQLDIRLAAFGEKPTPLLISSIEELAHAQGDLETERWKRINNK